MTKEDLSKFVERTVRWKLFDAHIPEARRGFADMSPDEFESLIDEALTAASTPRNPKFAPTSPHNL